MSRFALSLVRASDAERDEALARLRDGFSAGRLSDSSFIRRVDLALVARTRADLARSVADLPAVRGTLRRLCRGWAWLPRARVEPAVTGLRLPADATRPVRIGRATTSTLRLYDDTVSRDHAELSYAGSAGWVLADLGSMNGTYLNGLRITDTVQVNPGDIVRFGRVTYRLYTS
jgi:hypothetical protein